MYSGNRYIHYYYYYYVRVVGRRDQFLFYTTPRGPSVNHAVVVRRARYKR